MMSQHEARATVLKLAAEEGLPAAAQQFIFDRTANLLEDETPQQALLDCLKVAQYALLLPIIERGVKTFLYNPAMAFTETGPRSVHEVASHVGDFVVECAMDELKQDTTIETFATAYAGMRSKKAADKEYGNAIGPLDQAIELGGFFSAVSTLQAVGATAITVARQAPRGLTQLEHIAITRASHVLPLAHPLIHLSDLVPTTSLLEHIGTDLESQQELLRYRSASNTVNLAVGMQHWEMAPGVTIASQAEEHEDVRVGCPFSFAAKDIRIGYYETMVGLVVEHGFWDQVSNPA